MSLPIPTGRIAESIMHTRTGRIIISFGFIVGIFRIFFIDIQYWLQLWHRKRRMDENKSSLNIIKNPNCRWGIPSRSSRGRLNPILYLFFILFGLAWLYVFIHSIVYDQ